MLFYANERIFMDIVTLSSEPFYEIPVSFYEIFIHLCVLLESASAFDLKRQSILNNDLRFIDGFYCMRLAYKKGLSHCKTAPFCMNYYHLI